MFYNTNRATKAALKERELLSNRDNIITDNERLIRIQKKLKGLLITKFCRKYGIIKPEKKIENEIIKFVEGEKFTNEDLKKLEDKIKKLLEEKKLYKRNLSQINIENININKNNNINQNSMPNIINKRKITMSLDLNNKKKYNNIYEELAILESEESIYKPKIKKIDFSKFGNEWHAMNIYSKLLFDQQNKEIALKNKEDKKILFESLNKQIEDKNKLLLEEKKLEKEYNKILKKHNKKLLEIEKEKEKKLEEQKLIIQQSRLAQIEDNKRRKKLEELIEKKNEKKKLLEYKKENEEIKLKEKENEKKRELALKEAIKENELRKQKLLDKLKTKIIR